MKKTLHAAFAAAVGAIWLASCDAAPPPDAAVSPPVESEAIAADETLADTVRRTLADVMRDEDAYSRARRLGALIPTLGPEFVAEVKQTLMDERLDLGATEVELLVRFWATHRPEDAAHWALTKSPHGYRVPAVFSSFTPWAEADPQAALIATQRWADIPQRSEVYGAVQVALVRGWFKANPSDLVEFIRDIGMGLGRQRALAAYIRAMIRNQGSDAVVRWAESLPEEDDTTYKTSVYRQVAAALMLFDPEAGRRWCDAHCDGPYGNNLRNIIARRWVKSDGAAALAWLSSAPEGHEKNIAVRFAFADWGQADREAALTWMADQTAGELDPWLRPIFPVYARLLAVDSPVEAIEWAERIEGDDDREWALIEVVRAWRQLDEDAAEAWLLESSLSEEAREKARAPKPERRPNG